jgi:CHRD domain
MRGRTLAVLFFAGLVAVGAAVASANDRWSAHLTGDQERPNPVDTLAQGQVVYKLDESGTALHYKLVASNIENITQAHIHLRLSDTATTGGIVVWLYPPAPPQQLIPGRHDGVLAEGTITQANFMGNLAGQPFSALITALENGRAYTNVHTTANPPGEIRGDSR